jgi:hypothetical protein
MPEQLRAQHWKTCAVEARQLAHQMSDDAARRIMLKIANEFERIADRADVRELIQQSRTVSN